MGSLLLSSRKDLSDLLGDLVQGGVGHQGCVVLLGRQPEQVDRAGDAFIESALVELLQLAQRQPLPPVGHGKKSSRISLGGGN
jgi:hypothetical protein